MKRSFDKDIKCWSCLECSLLEAYHKESRIGFEVAKTWGFIWVITVGHVVYIVHAQDSLKIT